MTLNEAYFYAIAIIIVLLVKITYSHNCWFYSIQLGIKMRAATCSLLYRTALKLSQTSITEISSGKIVTLISKDVHSFDGAIRFINDFWLGTIEVAIMAYIMHRAIGPSTFVGIGFLIIIIPAQCKFFFTFYI